MITIPDSMVYAICVDGVTRRVTFTEDKWRQIQNKDNKSWVIVKNGYIYVSIKSIRIHIDGHVELIKKEYYFVEDPGQDWPKNPNKN